MRLTLFLAILSTTMAAAEHIAGQSMDKVKVDISVKEVPLKKVFQLIEQQSLLNIGYDLNTIPADR